MSVFLGDAKNGGFGIPTGRKRSDHCKLAEPGGHFQLGLMQGCVLFCLLHETQCELYFGMCVTDRMFALLGIRHKYSIVYIYLCNYLIHMQHNFKFVISQQQYHSLPETALCCLTDKLLFQNHLHEFQAVLFLSSAILDCALLLFQQPRIFITCLWSKYLNALAGSVQPKRVANVGR